MHQTMKNRTSRGDNSYYNTHRSEKDSIFSAISNFVDSTHASMFSALKQMGIKFKSNKKLAK